MRRMLVPAVLIALIAPMSGGIPGASASDDPDDPTADSSSPSPAIATGIIVKAKTSSPARRTSMSVTADRALPADVSVADTRGGPEGLSLLQLDHTVETADLTTTLAAVQARTDVEWAVPNGVRHALTVSPSTPKDPMFGQQRNLWDSVLPAGGYSTRVPALWAASGGTKGTSDTVVAVVDTGILSNHPDLQNQLLTGYDFVDDHTSAGDGDGWDANPADPGDWVDASNAAACGAEGSSASTWHGSHVAGIIAAQQDNGIGISGMAPGVKIEPVRVLGHCGGTDWDIVMGIVWAAGANVNDYDSDHGTVPVNAHPADEINLSLGGEATSVDEAQVYCDLYGEVAAIAREHGATVVAAAGNSSAEEVFDHRLNIPSSCPGYLSVASVDATGHRSWFSSGGEGVDVAAPGGDLEVEGAGHGIWSSIDSGVKGPTGSTYAAYEGTSMAAPAVAAAAALLSSLGVADPAIREAVITSTVQPFPAYSAAYAGRSIGGSFTSADLNCTTAICGAGILDVSQYASVPMPLSATAISGSAVVGGTLSATGVWRPAGTVPRFTWYRGTTAVATGASYVVTSADAAQALTVTATAPDGSRPSISSSASVVVSKVGSTVSFAVPAKVKKSSRAKAKVRVSVPSATGTIRVYDGRKRIAVATLRAGANGRVTVKLPKLSKGVHRIKVVYSGDAQVVGSTSKTRRVTSR